IDYLKKALWVPLRREGDTLVVLIDNPQDVQKVDTITNLLRGHKLSFAVGLRNDILAHLHGLTGEVVTDNIGTILGDLKGQDVSAGDEEAADAELNENDSAIIRLANQMIVDAFRARASDIHVEPYGAERDTVIRIRVDGSCLEYQKVPGAYRRDRRAPQDHGPARHRRASEAAGWKDPIQAPGSRDRPPRRHRADGRRQRGRRHAPADLQRADPPRPARDDRAQSPRAEGGRR